MSFSPSPQTGGAAGSSCGRTLTLPFLSSYSTSPSVSSSTRLTSVAFISGFCGRANERMFCERRRMRCASFWMMSAYLSVFSGRSFVATMMSLIIMIEVSGFLISWTMPDPIRPISASFSDWISTSIMRFFSVRSSEIAEVPTTVPAESRITEKAISTGIARPSFAARATSKLFGSPPDDRIASAASTGARAPSVSRKLQRRPSASCLVQPKSRAAPPFQLSIVPAGSKLKIASAADSTRCPRYLRRSKTRIFSARDLDVLGGGHEHVGRENRGERRHERHEPAAVREGDHGARRVPARRRAR